MANRAFRVLRSKPAQKGFVNASLFFGSSVVLLCLAAAASILFHHRFLPDQVIRLPLYLQYGTGIHPCGVANFPRKLKTEQDYDVTIILSVPPSPANAARGNFMISVQLLDAVPSMRSPQPMNGPGTNNLIEDRRVIFASRRPALIPYRDPLVVMTSRLFFLLYNVLIADTPKQKLSIDIAENLRFSRSSQLPASAYVEIESGQGLEIYAASLAFTARLRGLRWFMHTFPILTFSLATVGFWIGELLFMSLCWALWMSSSLTRPMHSRHSYKTEMVKEAGFEMAGSSLMEIGATATSLGGPANSGPSGTDRVEAATLLDDNLRVGTEADDEDDDVRGHDSGIGSSFSEGGLGKLRRRPSRPSF